MLGRPSGRSGRSRAIWSPASARSVGARRVGGVRRPAPLGRSLGPHLQPRARRSAPDRPGCAHATHGARPEQRVGGMKSAVVLMAYGSPERLADVPAYYADIRGGRPIAPERLADLVER